MKIKIYLLRLVCSLILTLIAKNSLANLNPAYSGSWYAPEISGSGYLVEILPNDQALVYWFTYNESGDQQWFIGMGETTENSIQINQLSTTNGGVFGVDFDPSLVNIIDVGTLHLVFEQCNLSTASYVINGTESSQTLSRLTTIKDLPCTDDTDSANTQNNLNQTGSWYNTSRSGEGFNVQVLTADRAFVNWFTYDSAGNQAWLVGIGRTVGNYIHVENMSITHGGRLDDFNPEDVVITDWGQLELNLGCETGSFVYDSVIPEYGRGSYDLSRITTLNELNCIEEKFQAAEIAAIKGLWASDGFGLFVDVGDTNFTTMQITSNSCLPVSSGPVGALIASGQIKMDIQANRIQVSALDSVSPVIFNAVDQYPDACQTNGTGFSNSPTHNFNTLTATIGEQYASFDARPVNWNQEVSTHQNLINDNMSDMSLFNVFADMLTPLFDAHVSLITPFDSYYGVSGLIHVFDLRARSQNPLVDQIIANYMITPVLTTANGILKYGMLDNNSGYISISRFNEFLVNGSHNQNQAYFKQQITMMFNYLVSQGMENLIIDLRKNGGGDSSYGLDLVGRFSHGASRLAFSETRPTATGMSRPVTVSIPPSSELNFDGDLVVLTSGLTGSAAEIATLGFKALPHVKLIGTDSFGILSRAERILPNGWILSITAGQIAAPNGDKYEAIGIPVDIAVDVFTHADFNAMKDSAIDAALNTLN